MPEVLTDWGLDRWPFARSHDGAATEPRSPSAGVFSGQPHTHAWGTRRPLLRDHTAPGPHSQPHSARRYG